VFGPETLEWGRGSTTW